MTKDLHELPKIRDSISFLYLEHCIIDQKYQAVEAIDADNGRTMIPIASLTTLMLGPGTSITHAAIKTLAGNGCLVIWCGEEGVRYYAHGCAETRKCRRLLHQAILCSDAKEHMRVVTKMYRFRFNEPLSPELSLEQVRGLEGIRVRKAYQDAALKSGIPWLGRNYDTHNWRNSDPINRALSTANACLNGVCHAAIVSVGYSPGLGFIHVGKQLSFVYDIADLYKVEITIPLAFLVASKAPIKMETEVRRACRDTFKKQRLLDRVVSDIDSVLDFFGGWSDEHDPIEENPAIPEALWSPNIDTTPFESQDGSDDT